MPIGAGFCLAPRLGVADDTLDDRKALAQPVFERVDQVMHCADRQRRIDAAMEINDLAIDGFGRRPGLYADGRGDWFPVRGDDQFR